jgi:hypothetical protein
MGEGTETRVRWLERSEKAHEPFREAEAMKSPVGWSESETTSAPPWGCS